MNQKSRTQVASEIQRTVHALNNIYSNKSSDEYKTHGDITKSPVYNTLTRMIADLSYLKSLNKQEIADIKNMFNVLHRPVFKNAVTSYIAEQNESDILITTIYTIGYRVLIGELSRIYTSTEATEKGFVYRPDKISRKNDMRKFIAVFNSRLDTELNAYIRRTTKPVMRQEAWAAIGAAAAGIAAASDKISPALETASQWLDKFFGGVTQLNPVSMTNYILSSSYNGKVAKFEETAALYQATKEAYDEYMKIPSAQRSKRVESKYIKNMEKYNIKMHNMHAKIAHYDQRALHDSKGEYTDDRSTDTTSTKKTPPTDTGGDNDDMDF